MVNNPGRQLLIQILRRRDDQIDLVRAALAITWEDLGSIDMDEVNRVLDALVARARPHLQIGGSLERQAEQIVDYLHRVEGFKAHPAAYTDPSSSYLPDVLEHHTGLPILLSLVLLHVGWKCNLPLQPAALPGHFMVRCQGDKGPIFLDLSYGRVLDATACRIFLQTQLGYEVPNPERFPTPARRLVLARLLRNLKSCYFRLQDWERALAATERIIMLDPESSEDIRDRGIFRARTGRLHLALLDFERYALIEPAAPDIELIRKRAIALTGALGHRN